MVDGFVAHQFLLHLNQQINPINNTLNLFQFGRSKSVTKKRPHYALPCWKNTATSANLHLLLFINSGEATRPFSRYGDTEENFAKTQQLGHTSRFESTVENRECRLRVEDRFA